ncbi:MAG TPA: hypothetical protein VIJ42_01005 [Stellaceae bacterium]
MGFYQDSLSLHDGAILLYTRPDRKKVRYQARLKVPGVEGYVVRSLKTADLKVAISEPEELFYQLRAEQKQGLDVAAPATSASKTCGAASTTSMKAACPFTASASTPSWAPNTSSRISATTTPPTCRMPSSKNTGIGASK